MTGNAGAAAAALGLLAGLAVAGAAGAATPCRDVPDFDTLGCRIDSLREAVDGVDGRLSRVLDGVARRVAMGDRACAAGRTRRAERGLFALGFRLRAVQRATERSVRRGSLHPLDARQVERRVRRFGALARAVRWRLARDPCPEWIDVLAPAPGALARDGEVFLLFELAAAADPESVEVTVEGPGGAAPVALAQLSRTQGWGSLACRGAGAHAVEITARARRGGGRGGRRTRDEVRVPFRCGASGFALGGEVEVLVERDHARGSLRLVPVRPLRTGATYAVAVRTSLPVSGARGVAATDAFREDAGLRGKGPRGTATAFYSADALDPRNPFPSERLVRPDGTIRIPDGFTARAVPDVLRLAGVRRFLRELDARSEEHRGFSPNGAVVLHFDAPIRLERADPEDLVFVEVSGAGAGGNLPELARALERERGVPAEEIALATVFPVEDLGGVMHAIREQVRARAQADPPEPDFSDPDPANGRRFGIFRPGDPGFADFFGGAPPASVGAVARGLFPSPDYREDGRFPERFLDGRETPPSVPIDFLLAVPAGAPPPGGFPVVVLQHGFGGDNDFVTDVAGELAAAGLAAIGIPAPEHGPRGSFFDFFVFDDFNAFGNNFRQASVDLLALARLIEAGIDLDGDGRSEVLGRGLGYLGVSLGGVIGGVFAAVEPGVEAAVLNVPGGRLAQFGGGTSSLAVPFLSRFADRSGIPVRTCGGAPTAPACAGDEECPGTAVCRFNADFELLLESGLPSFQHQLDPGDGAGYARRFRIDPPKGAARPVLVQEGIGDVVVANPLTEALARAIGLPANRPDAGPRGVAGLWRFAPPAGHGIFGLDSVRAQAIAFLRSGGTELRRPRPAPAPSGR